MKISKIIFLFIFLGFFNPFLHSEIKEKITSNKNNNNLNMYIDFMSSVNLKVSKNPFEKDVMERNIFDGVTFSADDLKLEMRGNVNEISFCLSQKLFHKKMDHEKEEEEEENKNRIDSYNPIIHLANLKYKWNEKLSFLIGKQPISFGSMEYHFVPISSQYKYSDLFHKNKDNNPIGINFIYTPIKNHEFQFQIVNSVNNNQLAEKPIPFRKVRYPMGYSFNWNWDFLKKKIQNRWSYSIFQENHKDKFWKLLALGSKLDFNPISIDIDYIFSDEDIERNGFLTKTFHSLSKNYPKNEGRKISPVTYVTYLVKLNYVIPKWNFFVKGAYDLGRSKEGFFETHWILRNQLFKKAYTYSGGVEYKYPINNQDIILYFLYTRKNILYLDYIQKENLNDHSISLGLNYKIQLL